MYFFSSRTKKIKYFILISIGLANPLAGQTTINNLPIGLSPEIYNSIEEMLLPPINRNKISPDSRFEQNETKPGFIAYNFTIALKLEDSKVSWETFSTDIKTFQIKIRSEGALGVGLVLSDVRLLPGEKLFIFNHNGLRGTFTSENVPPSGVLPINFLPGEEVVIEWDVPSKAKKRGTLTVETVSHAYKDIATGSYASGRLSAPKDDCYICFNNADFRQSKRAIVKIITYLESGTKICTGSLVNNTANDKAPYILTAQHCIRDQYEADRSVFLFSLAEGDCEEKGDLTEFSLQGAKFLAASYNADFALLKLNNPPPSYVLPYFAGWDISDQAWDHVSTIHRPHGGAKSISLANDHVSVSNYANDTSRLPMGFWLVPRWDAGVTESGSSGAPLFNKDMKIIGTLTGGSASCKAPYNDYFERLSLSWDYFPEPEKQLKYWLDPVKSEVKSLSGLDTYETLSLNCDSVSNIMDGEVTGPERFTPGSGYFSGNNSDSVATFAEKLSVADSSLLTAITINVASVNSAAEGGVIVSVNENAEGKPGTSVYQNYLPYHNLVPGKNKIGVFPDVYVKDDFFICYTITYSEGSIFAIAQSVWDKRRTNTAFMKYPERWINMSDIYAEQKGTSLDISASVCSFNASGLEETHSTLFAYPNPASSTLVVKSPQQALLKMAIRMYDIQGKQFPINFLVRNQDIIIDTHQLRPGVYILKLVYPSTKVYELKFVKQ